jgi:uncharacterized protein YceH (UPF0502 family)
MPMTLSEVEARVLGSLIEKSLTTPESYPLTVNGLVNACNQKTSREPLMDLDEATVARTLASLREKNLVFQKSESGNRAPRFGHRVENLLNGGSPKEVGAICVLLLRGPQTPGEIKTRTDRLCEFESVAEVATVLDDLANRPDGPLTARLARQPGQKETRYAQLFTGGVESAAAAASEPSHETPAAASTSAPAAPRHAPLEPRLTQLENRIFLLEAAVAELQRAKGVSQG